MNVIGTANISKDGKTIEVEVRIQAGTSFDHNCLARVPKTSGVVGMVDGFLVLKSSMPVPERRISERSLPKDVAQERRANVFAYPSSKTVKSAYKGPERRVSQLPADEFTEQRKAPFTYLV
jgi:hypothetical protein